MKQIFWLASYPKSGNTWFRAFLANLIRNPDQPISINEIETGPIASSRGPLHAVVGYESVNLSHDEADVLRREYYLWIAERAESKLHLKVHDAYSVLLDGRPLFPPEATAGVFYLVRNPLDVCVSYAHHNGTKDFDRTLRRMARPDGMVCGRTDGFTEQFRQQMRSWSGHVASWTEAPDQRVHLIRYEDMKSKPEATFSAAARFAGLPCEPDRIKKALAFSSFDELSKQENSDGFRECFQPDARFFRKGKVGSWRESLSSGQAARIVRHHGPMMEKLGYIDSQGELLC